MTELCRSHKRALPFQLPLAKKKKKKKTEAKSERQSKQSTYFFFSSDRPHLLSLPLSLHEMIFVRGRHLEVGREI